MFKVWLKKENSYESFSFKSLKEAKKFSIKNYLFFKGLWFDSECVYSILEREKHNDDEYAVYKFIEIELEKEN